MMFHNDNGVFWVKDVGKAKGKDLPAPSTSVLVAEKKTRLLFVSKDLDLYAVVDPYTGDQVMVDEWVSHILPYSMKEHSPFLSVFTKDETLCYRDGVELEVRPIDCSGWTKAMIERALELS